MKRYSLLNNDRVKVMSCNRVDVLVLAAYKFAERLLKWKDMVNSAKCFGDVSGLSEELHLHNYVIVDNETLPRSGQRWSDATARRCLEDRIKKANETIQTALTEITYCETKLTEMENRYV